MENKTTIKYQIRVNLQFFEVSKEEYEKWQEYMKNKELKSGFIKAKEEESKWRNSEYYKQEYEYTIPFNSISYGYILKSTKEEKTQQKKA